MNEQLDKCAWENTRGEGCRSWAVAEPPYEDYCKMHAKVLAKQDGAGELQELKPVGGVRARLAQAATEDYELIRNALKQALLAETTRSQKCVHCQRANTFHIPDHGARVKAAAEWLEQGFGRPTLAEVPTTSGDSSFARVLDSLTPESWDDFCTALLLKFAGIAAVRSPERYSGPRVEVERQKARVREGVIKLLDIDEASVERAEATLARTRQELRDAA